MKTNKPFTEYMENGGLLEASDLASDFHSGQWSDLYKLSCLQYQHWLPGDIDGMISEFGDCIDSCSDMDQYQIQEAIDDLTTARQLFNEEFGISEE